jgi:2-C-methyl-D-erythritol 4-phosphate cytidylyltransferase
MGNKVYAVVLAAGRGRRMGGSSPKQYMDLAGKPILAHTLDAFDKAPSVNKIIIVSMEEGYIRGQILERYPLKKPCDFAPGGKERQESVWNAISTIKDGETVVVHDGVRPLITVDVIEETIKAARQYGASAAGMPVKDTIKEINAEGFSIHTPNRSRLWMIQTPQAFQLSLLLEAHKRARKDSYLGTDDSSLVERMGHPVKLVQGGYSNIKITTPEDLDIAEKYIKSRRDMA